MTHRRDNLRFSPAAAGTGAVGLLALAAAVMLIMPDQGASSMVKPAGGAPAINKAIKECAEAGGGEVRLGPGTYVCDSPIILNHDRVSLRGSGPSTILKLANKANCPVVIVGEASGDPQWEVRGVQVSNLAIDGNREQQDAECWSGACDSGGKTVVRVCGIVVRRSTDILVENVRIDRCRSGGLVTEKGCLRVTVRQMVASDHEFDALACYDTKHSLFTHLHFHGNKAAGISTDGGFHDNLITNALITDNGTHGIYMRESNDNTYQGIVIRDSGRDGVFIDQVDKTSGTSASGNSFIGLHIARSGGHGIRINHPNCRDNLIEGTQFSENKGDVFEAAPGLAKFEAAFRRPDKGGNSP